MSRGKILASAAAAVFLGGALIAVPMANASVAAKPAPLASPLTQTVGAFVAVAPGGNGLASVACPAGKIITGGGGQTSAFDITFTDSYASGNGWVIRGNNRGAGVQSIRAVAVCLG